MATEVAPAAGPPAGPAPDRGPDTRGRLVGVGLAVALALVAVTLLATTSHIVTVAAGVTAVVVLVAAGLSAWRSFAVFTCGAIVARPLLDLAAGPRSAGLALTDVFGGAVLLVSLVWLWFNRGDLADRLRVPLVRAALAMLLVMALSAFAAPHITGAAQVVLRFAAGVAAFLVLDLLLHRRKLTPARLLGVLGLAYVVPLLFPLLGLVGVPVAHEKDGVTALKSVFYLSNNYGHFLVPLVIVSAAWFIRSRGRVRWYAGALLLLAAVELLGTQTRGAWFAALIGLGCVGMLLSRRFVLGAAVAAVLVVLFVPAVNDRLTSLEPGNAPPRNESSLAWRFGHWEQLLPLSMEEPLLGLGPDESVVLTGKEPHNDYVRALVETGVLGLAAYLWFLLQLVMVAGRAILRVGGTPLHRYLGFLGLRPDPGPETSDARGDALPAAGVVAGPLTQATVAGLGTYTLGVVIASVAENLIDNVTFLWVLMPCAAILVHVTEARGRITVDPRPAASPADDPADDPVGSR
ncbi:O-antigen ligase family protein [Nocardioides sp. SYSU DS0663]|uniref:O-antigen ligase family protein n=1 Tax=Nocardioides sp. SYSU DS0663 TaxID=3416445 RepID=UPI003F4BAEBE